MHGLIMIADDGDAYVAWHDVDTPPKDRGQALREWMHEWSCEAPVHARMERAITAHGTS